MGLMAGPLSPPMPWPSIGRRRRQSTAMPRQVLISERASAPPASAARAMAAMLGDVGGELGDDRQRAGAADARDHRLAHRRIGAEIDAAADVGTGDVQLQGVDAGQAVQAGGHLRRTPPGSCRRC